MPRRLHAQWIGDSRWRTRSRAAVNFSVIPTKAGNQGERT
jgi:hypothetical protein